MAFRYAVAALLAAAIADGFLLPRVQHRTLLKATKNDPTTNFMKRQLHPMTRLASNKNTRP